MAPINNVTTSTMNQHHGQQQQHHGQHNRNRGNFGNRNNNGFNHDRRNKDKGHRNHHQNQQFQMPQNSDIDMSPEEYAIWQASGGKIKGTNLTLKDPAEQEKWLEDRRKKWPTAARVAARKADEEEKQRAEQHDALQKKLESLDKTESQLRKRKLDEVDEEDKAKQPSKKKKKKKKKKRPQDDAPVAFEEQPTAANAEVTASEIPADDITVEEPADAPTEDVKETKSEVVVDEYEEPSLAADFDDFLLAEEMAESAGVQQVDLVTESPPNGQDQSAALLDLEQADVTVEEPQCPAPGENQSPTVEDEEGEESVAMSTSSTTGESAAESAEESGNGSDNGSDDGSDESDADAPPDEASTKPTGLPEKPPTAAANKKKQVCKLWLRKNCKYGAKCKYLHEGGVPKSDKERREEKKQQKDTSQKEMSLYDKLMQAQMEKENVKLLQAINFFVEKGILKA
ncbi:hypothetical protein DRE_04765 [Drechslerella stenobrocha 248]|uniref:C3H1-type domain-containing protein n=1 Tax=Drechslerella stenobrocha 248 TaxID=1043628 RepID=W7I0H8_9PEZI|nr:hypothetical protein DRE_04765 [Drechslerella stenobrocha 248]